MQEDCFPCKISLCVLLTAFLLGPQGPLLLESSLHYPDPCLCLSLTALMVRERLWWWGVCVCVCWLFQSILIVNYYYY